MDISFMAEQGGLRGSNKGTVRYSTVIVLSIQKDFCLIRLI